MEGFCLAVRSTPTPNIQFVNTTSASVSNAIRPIIFHQKTPTTSPQPQLLTVMPAGVRVQPLTPVVRGSSTQPTIVRLMSSTTTNVRPSTGQQQIIQLNTNKQQQPLVIKAISAQTSNRQQQQQQQQPILLAANTQQKLNTTQSQQQILVLNQNTITSTASIQSPKLALQIANSDQPTSTSVSATPTIDNDQQESTVHRGISQLDGCYDNEKSFNHRTILIPQLDGIVDDQVNVGWFFFC